MPPVYMIHRLGRNQGSNALEFNQDLRMGGYLMQSLLRFGAGPRICIGTRLSMNDIAFVALRMLQRLKAMKSPEG
jgi:cytochrome P450